MQYARGFRGWLTVILLAILVVGCRQAPNTGPSSSSNSLGSPASSSSKAGKPIVLGAVLPLSTSASLYGNQMIASVKLALKEVNDAGGINGRHIELVVEDSANSNTVALNALNKVLEREPVAMIGTVLGTQMLALLPVIDKEGVPTLTISGTRKVTQQGSQNVFRAGVHDGVAKVALAKYILDDMKKNRVGMIVVAEEWGYSARDIISSVLQDRGLKPVGVETYQAVDKDMSAQLLNLKKAGADVIIIQGYPADTALVLKQARQLNLGIPLAGSAVAQTAASLDITEGADVDGLVVEGLVIPSQSDDPKVQAWAKAFEQLNGLKPDQYGLLQYDAVKALIEVMKTHGPDRDSIRKGLREITYEGYTSTLRADQKGDMIDTDLIIQYDHQKHGKVLTKIRVPLSEQK